MTEHPNESKEPFSGITGEVEKLRVDLSVALSAGREFLQGADQSPSRAEELLFDIEILQESLSQVYVLDQSTHLRIAEVAPQLRAIARSASS